MKPAMKNHLWMLKQRAYAQLYPALRPEDDDNVMVKNVCNRQLRMMQ